MKQSLSFLQKLFRKFPLTSICLALISLAIPGSLFAALGENEASVQNDQVRMQANRRSIHSGNYNVHELRAPTGIVVREYVSSAGTVFGVAWEGPWPPDLQQILGSYFQQYQKAMQEQQGDRPGRRPIQVETSGLVVHLAGHPRSFAGHAYVPNMLPQGTSAGEIR